MSEYPTFGSRAKAAFIDGVVTILVFVTTVPLNSWAQSRFSLDQFSGVYLVTSLLPVAYYVLMQGKWGYTLGKKWMGLCLRMNNGSCVTWRAVVIRYLPYISYTVVWVVAWTTFVGRIDADLFQSATFAERMRYVRSVAPSWWLHIDKVIGVWSIANVLVLLSNRRRRALHDYIANTVVCYSKKRAAVMENKKLMRQLVKPPKL